jgi:putative ABC transport system permease protein
MRTIGARLALSYPQANRERGIQVTSASETYLGRLRSPLLLLLGAAGCVLLISWFNVSNLFLIRANSRKTDMAIRTALGAARGRLVRQWAVEGTVVAIAGGALGFLLAAASLKSIVNVLPIRLPTFSTVRIDHNIFAFAAIVSIVTGVGLGVVAALRASQQRDISESFKEGVRSTGGRLRLNTGGLLVTAEFAIAVVVTIGAGLLLRSFEILRHTNPGFASDHLVMARFDVPAPKYLGDARLRLGPEIAERVRSQPQVRSAALTTVDPFNSSGMNRSITVEGHTPLSASEQDEIYVQEISPDYFDTMKIPIRAGRDFTLRDNFDAPHLVIVSQAFAKRYWPGQAVIGKRIKYGPANSSYSWMEVVGEVADVRFSSLRSDPNSSFVIYAPLMQSEVIASLTVIARTGTDPSSTVGSLREEVQRIDPQIPVYSTATMDERIERETEATRSFALLLAMFALLGGGLSAVGAYAAMAARVSNRTREIGIRMAVGASPGVILRMVLRQGARLALTGVAAGLATALWGSRLLAAQLYGVQPTDPMTFASSAVLLFSIAGLACWLPARRAMCINPVSALRRD